MSINEIMETICFMSHYQGSYQRLYERLLDLQEYNPSSWVQVANLLEEQQFTDAVDIALYFEG